MTQATISDAVRPAKRWRLRPDPSAVPEGDWPPLIGRLLALRGVETASAARAFFDAAAPMPTLPDLEKAVERLARACREGETVAVFGDYDVDGITSTALLYENLTAMGAKVLPYLPHRDSEGYGLNNAAVDSLHALGATLLVTADCGTSSVDEVATARNHGMDVMILDHHTVPPLLPAALAIVNPKRDPKSSAEPSAGGICYYVLQALREAMDFPEDDGRMLELVALSTVCDLAPMVEGNRTLVRDGLRAIAKTERPGLRALMEVARIDPAGVDTEAIGFALGPRINAAGRMAHARLAFDLLVSTDETEAREIAAELDRLNRERRQATQNAVALADELIADETDAPLLMVGHEDLPAGIVGLVASKLVETHYKPSFVYQQGEHESVASARSIREFDVTGALRSCSDLFVRFGGHRMAAGFTAKNEQLPEIKERLIAYAAELLAGQDLTPALEIDAELPLKELRGEEIRWLSRLAPHGIENPVPTFLSRGVLVRTLRAVGKDGDHLKLRLKDGAVSWPAIAFRQHGDGIAEGTLIDLVWTLTSDSYVRDGLELNVLDLRPAEAT